MWHQHKKVHLYYSSPSQKPLSPISLPELSMLKRNTLRNKTTLDFLNYFPKSGSDVWNDPSNCVTPITVDCGYFTSNLGSTNHVYVQTGYALLLLLVLKVRPETILLKEVKDRPSESHVAVSKKAELQHNKNIAMETWPGMDQHKQYSLHYFCWCHELIPGLILFFWLIR